MIDAAEREGRIRPGESVIVEPTSGNTGVGLALVCAAKRYRLILTMPDNMSLERRALLKAYGAELHLTPAAQVMRGAVEKAIELAREIPGAFMPQQFKNPANVEAHFDHRAGDPGPARQSRAGRLRPRRRHGRHHHRRWPRPAERRGDVQIVAVEPEKSAVLSGGLPGEHRIDGIGAGFVPEILDRSVLSEVRTISEADAQRTSWPWPAARACWWGSPPVRR